MRAFTLDSFDAQPSLRDDLPEPRLSANELLVRVRASSVNNVDVYVAAGALKAMAEYVFPVTIGRDFAGVVEEVGRASAGTKSETRSSGSSSMRTLTCATGAGRS